MGLSLGDKQAALFMRNASSLSTESAEFEFDSCSFPELDNDELPLSPKLQLYSPHYSLNYSTNGENALMASINQFSAQTDIHASKADYLEEQGFDDHLAPAARTDHDLRANDNNGKEKVNLGSLLHRRDLEQLPPPINYHMNSPFDNNQRDINKQVPAVKGSSPASKSSTSSESPCSSPILGYRSTNPFKFEDDEGDASPPDRESSHKKNRKWAFNFDFLRKGPSPRSHPSTKPYSFDGIKSISQTDHCNTSAAAKEVRLDEYFYERNNAAEAARDVTDLQLNQRKGHSVDAAATCTAEARLNRLSNQSIHDYQVGAVAVITKLESPRQSMSRAISSPNRAGSRSTPISPAGSPPRSSHAGEGAFTPRRSPMSPHALHYEQQRARNEEVRRRTFLPYRQSLLSACFFPASASPPPPHSQQAVF